MEMDILEELDIAEDQTSFDFLLDETKDVEQAESFDWVAQETLVLISKHNGVVPSDFDLCGKKMFEWVSLATSGCQQKIVGEISDENLLEDVSKYADGYNFVAVFFSDTPLLKKETFLQIMDYFSKNRMNVMKLKRGYIFKAEYLKTAKIMMSGMVEDFGEEDFVVLDSAEKISFAFNILNKRILGYHKSNGVVLLGENTIFVDADVEIESGAIVYPNNTLKGQSYIGKNVILESGNYIIDTIVCDNAFVCQSYLENSKVEQNKIVGPFEKLINQKI